MSLGLLLLAIAAAPLPAEVYVEASQLRGLVASGRSFANVRKLWIEPECRETGTVVFPPKCVRFPKLEALGFAASGKSYRRQDCDIHVSLTPDIGQLTTLRSLALDETGSALPAEIGRLTNL